MSEFSFNDVLGNILAYWDKKLIKRQKESFLPRRGGGKVRISLRVISTTRLWHYCLYTYSLSTWSSPRTLKRNLILWWVSRLYAFSAYPFPT